MESDLGVFEIPYNIALLIVIFGHFFFAYTQWFKWPELAEKLTELRGEEIVKTASLGRSFASYNLSIGIGLLLSLLFYDSAIIQGVVLALISLTALVGASGTKGMTILLLRFLPALIALGLLVAGLLLFGT